MNDNDPSYSPSGNRIVYRSFDGSDYEVYTMRAGGGDRRRITNNSGNESWPVYSPSGREIA